jgi:hypothetical protein
VAESAQYGLLAVPLEGEAGQGWERLGIRFFIPCGKKSERFSVYVRRRCPLVVDGVARVAQRCSRRSSGRVLAQILQFKPRSFKSLFLSIL